VVFWSVWEQGHPVRATVSEMGPLLLIRYEFDDTQAGVLTLVFRLRMTGIAALDMKDLQAMLSMWGTLEGVSDAVWEYFGGSMRFSGAGGSGTAGCDLFWEPALNIEDLLQTDARATGCEFLAADQLLQSRSFNATFCWLMSECLESCRRLGIRRSRSWFSFLMRHIFV